MGARCGNLEIPPLAWNFHAPGNARRVETPELGRICRSDADDVSIQYEFSRVCVSMLTSTPASSVCPSLRGRSPVRRESCRMAEWNSNSNNSYTLPTPCTSTTVPGTVRRVLKFFYTALDGLDVDDAEAVRFGGGGGSGHGAR